MSKQSDFTPLMADIKKDIESGEKTAEPTEFINESFMRVGWKKKIILFLVFLLVCSTMFINDVVGKMNQEFIYDQRSTSNSGTVVQGIFLVLIYSLLEMLVNNKVL